MDIAVNHLPTRIYNGGRSFNRELPTVVLIHGAGHDHSVWNYQARYLAHHGYGVLAPDLPGHGASHGAPLPTIDALADWLLALADTVGCTRLSLVGHSMGALVALAAAARATDRVDRLILIGSVAPMPVTPVLIEAARDDRDRAHAMINQWSYSPAALLGASASPGSVLTGTNQRLMERQSDGVLATDLEACNGWTEGLAIARGVQCPTLLLCGERDQMTPPRAVKPLCDALVNAAGGARMMILPGAGHAMMAESPATVSNAIGKFLRS